MEEIFSSASLTLSFMVELAVIKYICRKHRVPTDISIFLYLLFYLLIFGYLIYTIYLIFSYVSQFMG